MIVPKHKVVYVGAKVFKEGQECPFLKDKKVESKKDKRDKKGKK